jgi:glucose-6-phosphate dehydrogenase assembly protein OpcA
MEDVMSEVAFSEINEALRRGAEGESGHTRALMATVVAVGASDRLTETAEALRHLAEQCAIRPIMISQGAVPAPPPTVSGPIVSLDGLKPQYVDNAVAALRLSSLPTFVWFRGGSGGLLRDLADLADRLVLDESDPFASWKQALQLIDRTAFSDLRWARLTRWRTLMANFFDIPRVRDATGSFTHLHISGSDAVAAKLYAAWLTSSLSQRLEVELVIESGRAPIERVRLGDENHRSLTLRLGRSKHCVHTAMAIDGEHKSLRIASLGDQRLPALMADELQIRARDTAFERAMAAAVSAA